MTQPGGWSRPDPENDPQRDPNLPPGQGGLPHAPPPSQGWGPGPGHGKPGVIPLRPLGLGEILDGSISTMRRHPALMIGAAAAVGAITQLISLLITWTMLRDVLQRTVEVNANTLTRDEALSLLGKATATSGLAALVTLVAQAFLSGFLIVVIGKAVLGRPATLRESLAEVTPRLLPLLGLTIVYTLMWLSVLLVSTGVGVLLGGAGVLLGLVGAVFSAWIYVRFSLAMPALVLERARIGQSLGRSQLLVRGAWWRTFGILLLTLIITIVISLVIGIPFGAASSGMGEFSFGGLLLSALGGTVAAAITYPFTAGVTALLYIDYRMRKEGMDIELARAASQPPEGPAPQS